MITAHVHANFFSTESICASSTFVLFNATKPHGRAIQFAWLPHPALDLLDGGLRLYRQQGVFGAERSDPSLVPSIFAPESAPAPCHFHLYSSCSAITTAIFVVVASLVNYVIVCLRGRATTTGGNQRSYGSGPIEVAWTTVPFLIVVVLLGHRAGHPGGAGRAQTCRCAGCAGHRTPVVVGISIPEARHRNGQRNARAGSGMPTFLDLRSADVVHSFWVPRLAGKTDLIPNRINSMWIEPERPGLFVGQCAKYCGTQHAKMLLRVYVDTAEDFNRWVKEQRKSSALDPAVAAGRLVFERTACINCHTVSGTAGNGRFGPDLTHLMSRETLGSGATEQFTGNAEGVDQVTQPVQTGSVDARNESQRSRVGSSGRLPRRHSNEWHNEN